MSSGTAAMLVRDARVRAGLSRRGLAAKAEVPTSTVSRIESGQTDPTVGMLQRVLEAAGARLVLDVEPGGGDPTLASLATAVDDSGARLKVDWTRLRGFADWASEHPDQVAAAIRDAPARTGTPLDAILAGFAEQLADDHGLQRPKWTRAVGPLDQEWSAPGTPRMKMRAEANTPEPFRRRNVVLARSALFREAA